MFVHSYGYLKFIHRFAAIIAPLTDLRRKDHIFAWFSDENNAFNMLKSHIKHTVVLLFLTSPNISTYIWCQWLCCWSYILKIWFFKQLTYPCLYVPQYQAQRNYPTRERELLALIIAVKQWRHYLLGHKINIPTDNSSLLWLRMQTQLSSRQARWLAKIADFDLKINHIPGTTNTAIDALSIFYNTATIRSIDWIKVQNCSSWKFNPINAASCRWVIEDWIEAWVRQWRWWWCLAHTMFGYN